MKIVIKLESEKYYTGYPTVPIGGGNPYYMCAICGVSDPEINGSLDHHRPTCTWAIQQKLERK